MNYETGIFYAGTWARILLLRMGISYKTYHCVGDTQYTSANDFIETESAKIADITKTDLQHF